MTDKIPLFFAGGTGFYIRDVFAGLPSPLLSVDIGFTVRFGKLVLFKGRTLETKAVVPGLNGKTFTFSMSGDADDPFCALLDPNIFEARNINYPASMFGGIGSGIGMGASITFGYERMKEAIMALRPGAPFALAGSSQGAAVCSSCYLAGLQPGTTGPLEPWRSGFIGYVGFGNPRRQRDYVAPYGVWSGSWYQGGSTDGGGAFPSTGPWRRLTNCDPDKWCEFANPEDIYSSNASTGKDAFWTNAIDVFLDLDLQQCISYLVNNQAADTFFAFLDAFSELAKDLLVVDAIGNTIPLPGSGHNSYMLLPPANADGTFNATPVTANGKTYLKSNTDTCYQLALKFLNAKAAEHAVSPSVLPVTPTTPSTAGWSTTLIPPAA